MKVFALFLTLIAVGLGCATSGRSHGVVTRMGIIIPRQAYRRPTAKTTTTTPRTTTTPAPPPSPDDICDPYFLLGHGEFDTCHRTQLAREDFCDAYQDLNRILKHVGGAKFFTEAVLMLCRDYENAAQDIVDATDPSGNLGDVIVVWRVERMCKTFGRFQREERHCAS